jgi:NAD(P)-dependent dehydrogenase (short-subunit alcohol dehydrogenase family)
VQNSLIIIKANPTFKNRVYIFYFTNSYKLSLVMIMQDYNQVQNKIALVTGSASGIGRATVAELVLHCSTLILPARNLKKVEELKKELADLNPNCNVDIYKCDLSSLSSMKTFLAGVKARYKIIDILINNAGVINYDIQKTQDNLEATFETNVMAQYLFNKELSPLVQKSRQGRIINLSSALYKKGKFEIDNLQGEKLKNNMSSGIQLYNNSNLERNMLTKYLADTHKYTTVTVNCIHPGIITTALGKQNSGFLPTIFHGFFGLFTKPATEGAQTTLHLALSKEGGEVTGKYWTNSKPVKGVLDGLKEDDIRVLVEYCEKLI